MRLVAYLRVSTDDKGQDPGRQRGIIEAWARRSGHAVVSWHTDEGTSGAKDPFQRQHVLAAIEAAKEHEAEGLVVEAIDRWTRGGAEEMFVTRFFLRLDHGLVLKFANAPEGMPEEMQEAWDAMIAASAKAFRTRLREQIRSGLARAKRQGWPHGKPGHPPKPPLTEEERAAVAVMRARGVGWRRCALEVSTRRGAFQFADPKRRRQVAVSEAWIRYMFEHGCKPTRSEGSRPATSGEPGVRTELNDGSGGASA